jgi:hypothetical protein
VSHPSREVNGSGRILYRVIAMESDHSSVSLGSGMPKFHRTMGELKEGRILAWSPSGERLCIEHKWHERTEVELVEVLA